MIRIVAEKLPQGKIPLYSSFPSGFSSPVFFVKENRESIERTEPGALHVRVPIFEIRHRERLSKQEIMTKTRKKVLFYVVDICNTLGFSDNCSIVMPLVTQATLPAQIPSDGELTCIIQLGLMLSQPYESSSENPNPSWVPSVLQGVESLRFFAENLERFEVVSDVTRS